MKNTLNRSEVDEHGVCWYIQKNGTRQRARVKKCETCDSHFLTYPIGRAKFCGPECVRKECARCGAIFRPLTNRQTFCSAGCKKKIGKCEGCSKEFAIGKGAQGRFCSTACFYEDVCPTGSVRDYGNGYKIVKVPLGTPGAKSLHGTRSNSWMLEHRYVMQLVLGRPLGQKENVHHLNGVRDDNRPENLELWKRAQPPGVRAKDYHCAGCTCFSLPR